jgi:iron complex transport system substrate-binding protein
MANRIARSSRGYVHAFDLLRSLLAALTCVAATTVAAQETYVLPVPALLAPLRVVSMNLCTDQMAMLLADAGQLISISNVATDTRSSAMADVAASYPLNSGLAEEIYLLHPDLVLAGRYTARASVEMLQRLGIRVEVFDIASSLADVRANLARMGELLVQPARTDLLLADFDARLAALRATSGPRPRAVLYAANGYTAGSSSLSGEILATAGFDNIAAEVGYPYGGAMPLEILAMANPDVIITAEPYPGASRAEEILDHPVVTSLRASTMTTLLDDADWVCETPYVLRAIERLADARLEWLRGQQ